MPRTHRAPFTTLMLLVGGLAIAGGLAPRPQPEPAPEPRPAQVPTPAGNDGAQPAEAPGSRRQVNPERLKAFREQLRKHVEERLAESRRLTNRLDDALKRLDEGADPREIKDVLDALPPAARRSAGGQRPGASPTAHPGSGPASQPAAGPQGRVIERPAAVLMGLDAEPVRPLSPDELDDALAQIRGHNADAAAQLDRLREDQPGAFKRVMEWLASRLGAIREAKEHGDAPMVAARWSEVRSMVEMFRVARAIEQAGPSAASDEREALQDRLREALGKQFDARMEIQALQIASLVHRAEEMRKNLENLRARRSDVIRESAQRAALLSKPGKERRGGQTGPTPPQESPRGQ